MFKKIIASHEELVESKEQAISKWANNVLKGIIEIEKLVSINNTENFKGNLVPYIDVIDSCDILDSSTKLKLNIPENSSKVIDRLKLISKVSTNLEHTSKNVLTRDIEKELELIDDDQIYLLGISTDTLHDVLKLATKITEVEEVKEEDTSEEDEQDSEDSEFTDDSFDSTDEDSESDTNTDTEDTEDTTSEEGESESISEESEDEDSEETTTASEGLDSGTKSITTIIDVNEIYRKEFEDNTESKSVKSLGYKLKDLHKLVATYIDTVTDYRQMAMCIRKRIQDVQRDTDNGKYTDNIEIVISNVNVVVSCVNSLYTLLDKTGNYITLIITSIANERERD